jgi:hypothetical protein
MAEKSNIAAILEAMKEASMSSSSSAIPMKGTAEEMIAKFNQQVDNMKTNSVASRTTMDFTRKQTRADTLLSSLHPISLAELEVGKTHRGCAVYSSKHFILSMNRRTTL